MFPATQGPYPGAAAPGLAPLDTPGVCADAHAELKKAVRCASDLFEANIAALAQIAKLQKEKEEDKAEYECRNEVRYSLACDVYAIYGMCAMCEACFV
jgi:hypothetical protein